MHDADPRTKPSPPPSRLVGHPQKPWLPPLPPVPDLQARGAGGGERILVAVGPEAGWDDPYELELLARHGFRAASLGPRTLRSDVALVALLALAHDRLRRNAAAAAAAAA